MRLNDESLKTAVINLMHEDEFVALQASRRLLDAGGKSLDILVESLHDKPHNYQPLVCLWQHLKKNKVYNPPLVDATIAVCNTTNSHQSQILGMAILGEVLANSPALVPKDEFCEFFLHNSLVLQIRSLALAVQHKLEYAIPWLGILLDDDYETVQKLALEGLEQSKSPQAAFLLREWRKRQR